MNIRRIRQAIAVLDGGVRISYWLMMGAAFVVFAFSLLVVLGTALAIGDALGLVGVLA